MKRLGDDESSSQRAGGVLGGIQGSSDEAGCEGHSAILSRG